MVYNMFQTKIIDSLQSHLGSDCRVTLQKVTKNNGTVLDGICVARSSQRASPSVYLNDYYEQYLQGIPFSAIVSEILDIYDDHSLLAGLDLSIFNDFSRLKERVACKLIHTASNRELLNQVPSVPYLDLSIVFYIYLLRDNTDQMTVLIRNDLMKSWNTNLDELYGLALENTPRLLPARIHSMSDLMQSIAKEQPFIPYRNGFVGDLLPPSLIPLYVQTNTAGYCGACTILYPDQLKNFADKAGTDLIILPSSIHEVLLIPHDHTFSFQELSRVVSHINRTEVAVEDRLSDQVYVYSRALDRVSPAGRPVVSVLS